MLSKNENFKVISIKIMIEKDKFLSYKNVYSPKNWSNFWEELNVGTVPSFKMHNIGTVPSFKMYNIGTVPTFKMHNVGTKVFI